MAFSSALALVSHEDFEHLILILEEECAGDIRRTSSLGLVIINGLSIATSSKDENVGGSVRRNMRVRKRPHARALALACTRTTHAAAAAAAATAPPMWMVGGEKT